METQEQTAQDAKEETTDPTPIFAADMPLDDMFDGLMDIRDEEKATKDRIVSLEKKTAADTDTSVADKELVAEVKAFRSTKFGSKEEGESITKIVAAKSKIARIANGPERATKKLAETRTELEAISAKLKIAKDEYVEASAAGE